MDNIPQNTPNLNDKSLEKPTFEKRGLHNWRNLFRKPTLYEWTILFMLIMVIMMGYQYKYDTQTCRETLTNLPKIACQYCQEQVTRLNENRSSDVISFNFKEGITNLTTNITT